MSAGAFVEVVAALEVDGGVAVLCDRPSCRGQGVHVHGAGSIGAVRRAHCPSSSAPGYVLRPASASEAARILSRLRRLGWLRQSAAAA